MGRLATSEYLRFRSCKNKLILTNISITGSDHCLAVPSADLSLFLITVWCGSTQKALTCHQIGENLMTVWEQFTLTDTDKRKSIGTVAKCVAANCCAKDFKRAYDVITGVLRCGDCEHDNERHDGGGPGERGDLGNQLETTHTETTFSSLNMKFGYCREQSVTEDTLTFGGTSS